MKSIRVKFSAIVLFLALLAIAGACQDPDAWEKRQNDRQPPEKVMNAIGVKPGMIIGEVGAGRGRYAGRRTATLQKGPSPRRRKSRRWYAAA